MRKQPPDDPIYDALVRLGKSEMTVRPAALTRDKYAALLDSPAVGTYVGPLASDEQRARRASDEIKAAVADLPMRDRRIGEAVLCTNDDFDGLTVNDRKYQLLGDGITHDIYREARLRVLERVFNRLKNPPGRKGLTGVALHMGVARAGIALYYASLSERFRLQHARDGCGVEAQTWNRFVEASAANVFDAFVALALCEDDVHIDEMFDDLSPTSPPGAIAELHSLISTVVAAGPLDYHHIQAARGLSYWRETDKPPLDIRAYLYEHVWAGWYDDASAQRIEPLLTGSTPFIAYADRYCHIGQVFAYRQRRASHDHLAEVVPAYLSPMPMKPSLRDQVQAYFLEDGVTSDITEDECQAQEYRWFIDMEQKRVS